MTHILFDEKIYYCTDEKNGTLPKNELGSLFKENGQKISIAFVNIDPRILALPEDHLEQREKILHEKFPQEFLVQYERIGLNLYQVFAARKGEIEEVYQLLGRKTVQTFVPYAVAVRAYLNSQGLLKPDQSIVFIDDLKDQILLTMIEGAKVSPARHLLPKSPQGLISEVRRSEQKYSKEYNERYKKEPRFRLTSNNQEIINEVIAQGLHNKEETSFINADFPALEGLKQARFDMHFLLPEEVLKQKRKKEFKKQVKTGAAALACLILGILFFFGSSLGRSTSQEKQQLSGMEKDRLLKQLRLEHKKKYKNMLIQNPKMDISYVYFEFLNNLPEGYNVDYFLLTKSNENRWRWEAVVYGKEETGLVNFPNKGIFKERTAENIMVKNQPGQKITLEIFSETKPK